MGKIICKKGHTFNSNKKNPKNCSVCDSIYLWNINTKPEVNVSNIFNVSVKNGDNETLIHSYFHGWEIEKRLDEFKARFPEANIIVNARSQPSISLIHYFRNANFNNIYEQEDSHWGATIGFSSSYGENNEIVLDNSKIDFVVNNDVITQPLMNVRGSFFLDYKKFTSVFSDFNQLHVLYNFSHIQDNYIFDFTADSNVPMKYST